MELADRLDRDLRREGYETWLDRSEIDPGDGWALAIEQAIDASDGLLALLTRSSYTSQICRGEQSRALRKGKFVIPILVQRNADRPVYLEHVHYLDFTSARAYREAFQELIGAVREQGGMRWENLSERDRALLAEAEQAPLTTPLASWQGLYARAEQHTQKLLADLTGTAGRPGVCTPELYIARTAAEAAFERFLASDNLALALVGDTGAGKTNLLCHEGRELMAAGHAVFLYNGVTLLDPDIGQILSQDLSVDAVGALGQTLERIEDLARAAGRKVVVILDGLNDFRGRQNAEPEQLLRHLNNLIDDLPGCSLRLVFSCSSATWHRLDRQDALRQMRWSRFHRPDGADRPLTLHAFTPEELEAAYARYQESFALQTDFAQLPPSVRAVVREPLLLRLLAEAYGGKDEPITEGALDVGVYRQYWEQRIRRPRDQRLVEDLAAEMLARRRASLAMPDLARHDPIGPEILSEDADSSFHRLLEQGVLTLTPGDLFVGDSIRFTHPTIGAYALARHLRGRHEATSSIVTMLVSQADAFSLAWDAAKALLLIADDTTTLAELAGASDPEKRELVAETLCRLHALKPAAAQDILQRLMDGDSEEARRTALRAAYGIGPATRELFLRAAMRGSPDLRQAAKDTLYLIWRHAMPHAEREIRDTLYIIWRHDADFTYGVLRDLLQRIRLRDVGSIGNTLEFIVDLSITIYINHCEREDVIRQTVDLYYDLTVDRLHLNRVNLGRTVEDLVLRAVAAAFSRPILKWMLFTDADQPERFFQLSREEREPLRRIGRAFDPAERLEDARADLKALLERDIPLFNGAAALALAVHSCSDFPAIEPLHRRLFDELGPHGRLWQLLGFGVLLPETPHSWTPLLEDFTRRLLEENFANLDGEAAADLVCVPLGLAYGKVRQPMDLYDEWLRDGLGGGARGRISRVLAGLGPVGFYFPDAVFETLRPFVLQLARDPYQQDFSTTLAVIRTLHFDAVDAFLAHAGVDEAFRRRVSVSADVSMVHRYIDLLGFYNNAVHFSVHYPRMRRAFSTGACELMATAGSPNEFIVEYAKVAIQLLRDADFRLLEWTRPDELAPPAT